MKLSKEQKKERKSALVWLWKVSGSVKVSIVLLTISQTILSVISLAFAWLLRNLIDCAVDKNGSGVRLYAGLLAVLVLFQIAFGAVNRFLAEYAKSGTENAFKARCFTAILHADYAAVTAVHSGEWMNRLTSDTIVVAEGISQILPAVTGMLVKLLGALAMLLFLIPAFGHLIFPAGLLLMIFTYIFRRKLKLFHKQMQEADGRLRVYLSERLSCLMIVRAFSREKETIYGAEEKMSEHRAARMKKNRFSNICNVGFGSAMNGMYVLGAVYCAYGILSGVLSYGTYAAVMELVANIQSPFANITGYLPKYYAMIASAERLMEIEKFCTDVKDAAGEQEIKQFYQNEFEGLRLHDISFTYPQSVISGAEQDCQPQSGESGALVISGLNLEIKKGGFVAFVGPSGCGKSTVLKLLMCLYLPDSGERDILTAAGHIPLTSAWRGLFAYVPQGNQLMSGSIREIIAFGDKRKMQMDEALNHALKIACADKFVENLEHGIDTVLGERGTGLSEGQMQRIAIARAVFSERPILLLDEATSSLDEDTEALVLTNLRTMTEKTVIIVTHRPAAREIVDRCIEFTG